MKPFNRQSVPGALQSYSKVLRLFSLVVLLIILMTGQQDVRATNWTIPGIPEPPTDQKSFLAYLVMTGQQPYSRQHRYPASYATYRDYRLLVYGYAAQVPGNRYSSTYRQNAYLGFSYDELKVTNTLFPDDSPGGVSKSKPFSWAELNQGSEAVMSWSRLNDAQKRYLKEVPLTYRNQSFGLMNFSNLGLNEKNTIVLAPPSWHLGSALYTEHYLPNVSYKEMRYATFYCSGNGGVELTCSIDLMVSPDADGYYSFSVGSDEMRIPYRATGSIQAMTGLARQSDIVIRGVGSADGYINGTGSGPFIFNGELVVNRSSLGGLPTGSVQIRAKTFVVSAMGDIIIKEAVKSLPIRGAKPIASLTVEANISGSIGYFSGSRSLIGFLPATSNRRFLGLETIWLSVHFNKPVQRWTYSFLGEEKTVYPENGQHQFVIPIRLPLNQSSLTWQDERIRTPYQMDIIGLDLESPSITVSAKIDQIELTGDIFDLLYLQLG